MTIVSVFLVASFTSTAIWRKKELPDSISSLVWLFTGKWRWVWSVWLLAVAITTFAPAIDLLDAKGLGAIAFAPMVLLAFVAAWPLFDEDHENVHNIFGIAAGAFSQVAVAFLSPWWLFLWMLFAVMLADAYVGGKKRWYDGKEVFIAEAICAVNVWGACLVFL